MNSCKEFGTPWHTSTELVIKGIWLFFFLPSSFSFFSLFLLFMEFHLVFSKHVLQYLDILQWLT